MKTISKLILGIGIAGTSMLAACAGTYYVAQRPVEPVYVRPVAPYADAYWVPGEWVWNGITGRLTSLCAQISHIFFLLI